ncbi:MAG TPA: DUF748 domain-containing protein [Lacunisphaera sp.]|nr:DUF748 domain-containing protein [Lacunisphaera sp.]
MNRFSHPSHPLRRWLAITGLLLALALVGARLALPGILKNAINRRLEAIPAYTGQVDKVTVSLLRGAYAMEGVRIAKREAETTHPFVAVEHLDFSLAWQELLHGQVVSEIVARRARLNFVQAGNEKESQLDFDRRWQNVIHDLFPIEITHFEVTEGELHFVAPAREPPVDIFVRNLHVRARGLRNRPDLNRDAYPATVLVEGVAPGNGNLSLTAELEPLAAQPRFHLRLKVDKLSLPAVNQFLQAYANVDVSSGEFTGYLEMVARNGRYEGYLKPFFENLVFQGAQDREKNLFARLWEKIVAVAAHLLKNNQTDQVAMRVPFSGEFGATSVGFWESVRTLLRNAFVEALKEGLDGHPRPKGDPEEIPPPPKAEEAGVTK